MPPAREEPSRLPLLIQHRSVQGKWGRDRALCPPVHVFLGNNSWEGYLALPQLLAISPLVSGPPSPYSEAHCGRTPQTFPVLLLAAAQSCASSGREASRCRPFQGHRGTAGHVLGVLGEHGPQGTARWHWACSQLRVPNAAPVQARPTAHSANRHRCVVCNELNGAG